MSECVGVVRVGVDDGGLHHKLPRKAAHAVLQEEGSNVELVRFFC